MFCPEGYKTIHEVRCSVSSFQFSRADYHDVNGSDVFEALVFDTIVENDALRICSPNGKVLKMSVVRVFGTKGGLN